MSISTHQTYSFLETSEFGILQNFCLFKVKKKFFDLIESIGTSNNYFQKCSNASFPPKHFVETSSNTFVQDNTVWMRNGCLGKIDSSVGDAWTKCQVYTVYTVLYNWGHRDLTSGNTTVGDPKIYVGLDIP
jgi:hypothetical protein